MDTYPDSYQPYDELQVSYSGGKWEDYYTIRELADAIGAKAMVDSCREDINRKFRVVRRERGVLTVVYE